MPRFRPTDRLDKTDTSPRKPRRTLNVVKRISSE